MTISQSNLLLKIDIPFLFNIPVYHKLKDTKNFISFSNCDEVKENNFHIKYTYYLII